MPRDAPDASAAKTCPDCGGDIAVDRVASQYQEDVPDVRPLVRRFDIEVGHCARCRRRWLWAYATPVTTVYSIRAGRGFADAAAVLGADIRGRAGARRVGGVPRLRARAPPDLPSPDYS